MKRKRGPLHNSWVTNESNNMSNVWCHYGEAITYTSAVRPTVGISRVKLPSNSSLLLGDIGWPTRSTDLSSCDIFSFTLVSSTQTHFPYTISQLNRVFIQEVTTILHETIHGVDGNLSRTPSAQSQQ